VIRSELSGDVRSVTASATSLDTATKAEGASSRAVADSRLVSLVRDHYAFVWRVLRRFGLRPSDADDAAQQVFLVLSRRLDEVAASKERAFLFRTAMHVSSKVHRARRRRPEDPSEESDESEDPAPQADELLELRRARELLDRVLSEMPDDLKAVVVLFEIEGLTMSEIADALELRPGTVASRLRRARAELEARVMRARAARREVTS
jgi:RNA polymerase sigma-70 factor (ECF subfamily)